MPHQTEYDLRMRSYKSITDAHLIPRTPSDHPNRWSCIPYFLPGGFKKTILIRYLWLLCAIPQNTSVEISRAVSWLILNQNEINSSSY